MLNWVHNTSSWRAPSFPITSWKVLYIFLHLPAFLLRCDVRDEGAKEEHLLRLLGCSWWFTLIGTSYSREGNKGMQSMIILSPAPNGYGVANYVSPKNRKHVTEREDKGDGDAWIYRYGCTFRDNGYNLNTVQYSPCRTPTKGVRVGDSAGNGSGEWE